MTTHDLTPARNLVDTGRLLLVELLPGDAGLLLAGHGPEGRVVARGYPLEGTRIAARMLLDAAEHGGWQPGFGMYQITVVDDGVVVGDVGFHGAPTAYDGSVEIGYGVVPAYRGRGIATEAAAALAGWAHRQPGVATVVAETETGNVASQQVLWKAGFAPTGEAGTTRCYTYRGASVQGPGR